MIRVRLFRTGLLSGLATSLPVIGLLEGGAAPGVQLPLLGASVLLAVGALAQGRGHAVQPWVGAGAALGAFAGGSVLVSHPAWTFLLTAALIGVFFWRRRPARAGTLDEAERDNLPLLGAAVPALSVVVLVALARDLPLVVEVGLTASAALVAGFGGQSILRGQGAFRTASKGREGESRDARSGAHARASWGPAVMAAWVVLVGLSLLVDDVAFRGLCLVSAGLLALVREEGAPFGPVIEAFLSRPEAMLAGSFGAAIALGAVLLALPLSAEVGRSLPAIDAVFTAVSAACVTGLAVVDTPTTFSFFGEAVILMLIQLGGLGIMTFSTAALFIFGRRVSLRYERSVSDLFVTWEDQDPAKAVRSILVVTVIAEGAGALFLATRFATQYGEPLGAALWRGVFTAVSAFCNAGFSLQTDSLIGYQEDPLVLIIVAALVFVGALGPVVVITTLTRRSHHIPVRLMLSASVALVLTGTLLIGTLEWNQSLAGLSPPDRAVNAFFQSVTLRTAGFNSVDFMALRAPTLSVMLLFMFIGGAPGSTAGGVKTTTFAVLVLSVLATLQGRPAVVYRRRRITHATFYRAAAIVFLGATSALGLWTALLITQDLAPLPALFETVSALGTVGLSVGGTGELDAVGKVLVATGMFLGRLGPISVLLLFASSRRPPRWDYAEQDVPVG